jgi:hypothetical protein
MSVLTRVQANPDISTANATYVGYLVDNAKRTVASLCNLPRFPELEHGYVVSAVSATEDISGLDSNDINVAVNGSDYTEITLTLANCTTGENTAAELQSKIRALDGDYGEDEVTVTFSGTQYTVTSGRYGSDAWVRFSFDDSTPAVCRALKLSPEFGAVETVGGELDEELEDIAVHLVEWMYRKLGNEGIARGSPDGGTTFSEHTIMSHPFIGPMIRGRRKVYR